MNTTSTHGHTRGHRSTPEYSTWCAMKARCFNPKNSHYPRYGGRGITVCERWRESFEAFLEDMGPRPTLKHTIDRIDGTQGYSPDNCRWATNKEQTRNMEKNIVLEVDGQRRCLSEWAEITGIPMHTLHSRVTKLGWDADRAVKTPHRPRGWAKGIPREQWGVQS